VNKIARVVVRSECLRIQAGAETPEGCSSRSPWATAGEVGAEQAPIETLGRRRPGDKPRRRSAREEAGRNPRRGVCGTPRGAKPRGASSGPCANTTPGRQGLPEGAKPRNRGLPSRPSLRCGYTGRRNGQWGLPPGNGMDTFRKEKAPKGESQERCRCETKPARDCGEKAVKRVTKP